MHDPELGLTVAFNGCIYNYAELRRELLGKGYRFFSHSDTEVVLKGYKEWGDRVVEHLFGMIIGTGLAHVGRVKVLKATTDARKHTLAATFYGIALIVILASIPWPGMAAGRPVFRLF